MSKLILGLLCGMIIGTIFVAVIAKATDSGSGGSASATDQSGLTQPIVTEEQLKKLIQQPLIEARAKITDKEILDYYDKLIANLAAPDQTGQ